MMHPLGDDFDSIDSHGKYSLTWRCIKSNPAALVYKSHLPDFTEACSLGGFLEFLFIEFA